MSDASDEPQKLLDFNVWTPRDQWRGKFDPKYCAQSVWPANGHSSHQCRREGKYEYGGHLWCGIHHPPTVHVKRAARTRGWEEEQRRKDAAYAAAEARSKLRDAALDALRQIAAGHNDPRGLALEVFGKERP